MFFYWYEHTFCISWEKFAAFSKSFKSMWAAETHSGRYECGEDSVSRYNILLSRWWDGWLGWFTQGVACVASSRHALFCLCSFHLSHSRFLWSGWVTLMNCSVRHEWSRRASLPPALLLASLSIVVQWSIHLQKKYTELRMEEGSRHSSSPSYESKAFCQTLILLKWNHSVTVQLSRWTLSF